VELKPHGKNVPYEWYKGEFSFVFSLAYASAPDLLPRVEQLCQLAARMESNKAERAAARAALQSIIAAHEAGERFNPGWLEEDESVELEAGASRISPLTAQPGRVVLTQAHIYFQSYNVVSEAPVQAYELNKVRARMGTFMIGILGMFQRDILLNILNST
jgi:hypothetical protein